MLYKSIYLPCKIAFRVHWPLHFQCTFNLYLSYLTGWRYRTSAIMSSSQLWLNKQFQIRVEIDRMIRFKTIWIRFSEGLGPGLIKKIWTWDEHRDPDTKSRVNSIGGGGGKIDHATQNLVKRPRACTIITLLLVMTKS